jgi:hypothetical protein
MTVADYSAIAIAVREDIRCHRENGVDLNPYSTYGARTSWQHGFDGKDISITDRIDCYRRGSVAAEYIKEL